MIRIFPSLISANPLQLATEIELLEPHCDGFHIDIMDNHFVPNLTWGPLVANPIAAHSRKPCWVHLMVEDNLSIISRLQLPAQSIVSFHIESAWEAVQTIINTIESYGWTASIAIKPNSSLTLLRPWLAVIPHILIMSVEPGFSGQRFIHRSIELLQTLMQYRNADEYRYRIGMDGGIHADNIALLAAQGVEDIAVASAIFAQPDRIAALQILKERVHAADACTRS